MFSSWMIFLSWGNYSKLFNLTEYYLYIYIYKSKVGDRSRGRPEGSFSIATTPRCRDGGYSFPWFAPLYSWSIPYKAECLAGRHQVLFLSLWYDSTRDWTPVSRSTDELSTWTEAAAISHCANILGKGMHPTILHPSLGK